MSTAARKTRKRLRREALDLGLIDIAERLRFVHPTKVGTPGRHDSAHIPRLSASYIDAAAREFLAQPHGPHATSHAGWFRRLFGRLAVTA